MWMLITLIFFFIFSGEQLSFFPMERQRRNRSKIPIYPPNIGEQNQRVGRWSLEETDSNQWATSSDW